MHNKIAPSSLLATISTKHFELKSCFFLLARPTPLHIPCINNSFSSKYHIPIIKPWIASKDSGYNGIRPTTHHLPISPNAQELQYPEVHIDHSPLPTTTMLINPSRTLLISDKRQFYQPSAQPSVHFSSLACRNVEARKPQFCRRNPSVGVSGGTACLLILYSADFTFPPTLRT